MSPQPTIPQEKLTTVFRGLRQAFGAAEIEDIRALSKVLSSALVFSHRRKRISVSIEDREAY
jgi:hypothetical protein